MAATSSGLLFLFLGSFLEFFRTIGGLFRGGAWAILVPLFFVMTFKGYLEFIRRRYIATLQWTFLKVSVPSTNERTPRSMEEVFNGLHGLHRPPDLYDYYLDGYVQAWMSLELRGTHNGVSFIMRIPAGNRDLVEAAIYSQYPEASIEEVPDYAAPYTRDRLEKDFDCWGTEMILTKEDAYPIKTYIDFEDQFGEESRLVDPVALLTEFLSAITPGEELWVQMNIRPVFNELIDWQKEGMQLALKMAGREVPKKATRVQQAFQLLNTAATVAVTLGQVIPESEEMKKEDFVGALKLTPGETDIVRAIQRNVSKVGFQTNVRVFALGPMGVFKRRARIPILFGMFRPFANLNLNSFKPDRRFGTSIPVYGFVAPRQRFRKRKLLRRYKERIFYASGFILNVEELATLYHFPVTTVKTPTLDRARAKRGEAPTNVPLAPQDLPLA